MENIKQEIKKILCNNFNEQIVTNIKDGLNSDSYQLRLNNQKYFLKIFPIDKFNKHDRINSELIFSEFLRENGFKNFPNIISHDKKDRWILYKWIEGKKIKNISKIEVKNLIEFLIKIQTFRNKVDLSIFPKASEACFSLAEHQKLISLRLENILTSVNNLFYINNKLKNAIKNDLLKKFNFANDIHKDYLSIENFWDYELDSNEKCISPSDVGFHNIIKVNKDLIYFDFEFSGIDDPCKLIADLMIQPDYSIPVNYVYIIKDFISLFNEKIPYFRTRLKAILDLYQIKWFCIILNPIIKSKNKLDNKAILNLFIKSEGYFTRIEKQKLELFNILGLQ